MSLSIERSRAVPHLTNRGMGADYGYDLRPVSESEVVGLAVELLKQKGAVEVESRVPWSGEYSILRIEPKRSGTYLVVPLDALEEQ